MINSLNRFYRILRTSVTRNQIWQKPLLDRSRLYLDIGCGKNRHEGFIHLDRMWRPGIDLCWDVTRGIPLPDGRLKGIFTEHCLEHLPFESASWVLKECRRVLQPDGILRVIVPDAGLYLNLCLKKIRGESIDFPVPHESLTPLMYFNRLLFRSMNHHYAYDFETLSKLLKEAGFTDIRRESLHKGRDPQLLIDKPSRAYESLYVEASHARLRSADRSMT